MARPTKTGWDYYPQDVNEFTSDKFIFLREKCGHNACFAYLALKSDLFNVGACYKWNDDVAVAFCARHGLKIADVESYLEQCLARGLFSRQVYNETGCLTSFDIQKLAFTMARSARRKSIQIPSNVILVSPEEYEDLSVELTSPLLPPKVKESKVKESKVKDAEEIRKNSAITLVNPELFRNNSEPTTLIKYGKFLSMEKSEMDKILKEFSEALVKQEIPECDEWIEKSDKPSARKYRKPNYNHYLFFRQTWLKNKSLKNNSPQKRLFAKPTTFDLNRDLIEQLKNEPTRKN